MGRLAGGQWGRVLVRSMVLLWSVGAACAADGVSLQPTGISAHPCPALAAPSPGLLRYQERLLQPGVHWPGPPDPADVAPGLAAAEGRLHNDWPFSCRYRAENAALLDSTRPRAIFIGDSITEFWELAHPEFFRRGFIDRGISGQTTGQILLRFRQDVIALNPALVHIMAGTNDIAGNAGPTTLEAIEANILSMIELAQAHRIRIVLASTAPAGKFYWSPKVIDPAGQIAMLNRRLEHEAAKLHIVYVDYHAALSDDRGFMKAPLSNDGVHPNREGYALMEPLALRAIQQALR